MTLRTRSSEPRREEDRQLLRDFGELSNYVCPVHFQDREETKEHRANVCRVLENKADKDDLISTVKCIENIKTDMKTLAASTTPWKVFALSMLIILGAISGTLTLLSHQIEKGQDEIKGSLSIIHRRVSETNDDYDKISKAVIDLQYSMNAVANRLDSVEKRLEKK